MVGGVFSQQLGTTGNPAPKNAENDASNSQDHKDKENGLRFIEINELTHPSDHRGEKLTDQGKKRGKNRRSSALKSSSFHKNIYGHLSRTEQENQHRENSSEDNKIANFGDRKDTETIL
nr:MAG TPA: hypothetical protein [Inoviridae sp.]